MKLIQNTSFTIRKSFVWGILILLIFATCKVENTKELSIRAEDMFSIIAKYKYGDSRSWMQDFQDMMKEVYNTPDVHAAIEQRMIFLLQSGNVSTESKWLISQYLGTIATRASVLPLGEMLLNEETSDMARIALERIPDPKVDEVLRGSLIETQGTTKVGIINSLAARQDPKAVESLTSLINDGDEMIEKAAIAALGKIGGDAALEVLTQSFEEDAGEMKWIRADALLHCNRQIDDPEVQLEVYKKVYASDPPTSLRFEAFEGVLSLSEKKNVLLLEVLQSADDEMQRALMPFIRELPASTSMGGYISMIDQLPDKLQLPLLLALADRGEPAVRPIALRFLKKDDPEMRMGALKAMMKVGTADDVVLIANIAAESDGKVRELAQECLNEMQGSGMDQRIMAELSKSEGTVKSELIRSIGYRNITQASDNVMTELNNNDPMVRSAAIICLGLIAPPEYLSRFIDLTADTKSPSAREETIQSITNMVYKIADPARRTEEISSKMSDLEDPETIGILIHVLGKIGDDKALATIRPYQNADDYKVRLASAEALSEWPDASAINDLKILFDNTNDERIHTLAVKGYVQSVLMSDELNETDKADRLKEVNLKTMNSNEQTMVITGLSRVESLDALSITIDLLEKDDENTTEIEQAILRIAGNLKERFPEKVISEMTRAGELSSSPEFDDKVKLFLKSME